MEKVDKKERMKENDPEWFAKNILGIELTETQKFFLKHERNKNVKPDFLQPITHDLYRDGGKMLDQILEERGETFKEVFGDLTAVGMRKEGKEIKEGRREQMSKKNYKEKEMREELKMWNIVKNCFKTDEIEKTPFRMENCEEGGLDIFHVADRMNLNFDETIKS